MKNFRMIAKRDKSLVIQSLIVKEKAKQNLGYSDMDRCCTGTIQQYYNKGTYFKRFYFEK